MASPYQGPPDEATAQADEGSGGNLPPPPPPEAQKPKKKKMSRRQPLPSRYPPPEALPDYVHRALPLPPPPPPPAPTPSGGLSPRGGSNDDDDSRGAAEEGAAPRRVAPRQRHRVEEYVVSPISLPASSVGEGEGEEETREGYTRRARRGQGEGQEELYFEVSPVSPGSEREGSGDDETAAVSELDSPLDDDDDGDEDWAGDVSDAMLALPRQGPEPTPSPAMPSSGVFYFALESPPPPPPRLSRRYSDPAHARGDAAAAQIPAETDAAPRKPAAAINGARGERDGGPPPPPPPKTVSFGGGRLGAGTGGGTPATGFAARPRASSGARRTAPAPPPLKLRERPLADQYVKTPFPRAGPGSSARSSSSVESGDSGVLGVGGAPTPSPLRAPARATSPPPDPGLGRAASPAPSGAGPKVKSMLSRAKTGLGLGLGRGLGMGMGIVGGTAAAGAHERKRAEIKRQIRVAAEPGPPKPKPKTGS
ncbi:hypothetical protein GGS23DRAFT_611404 [Durotheca rogersii]|uniref:uncharacterized protein n=1 Tax=Durotheca rogersii TaxID=419775 RepID=UPI00221ECA8B|nr:uncharacterized protein GGS23DRAFT_611404 [Durotheca rogersii]KAI5861806.1 hypothetical protein GGS23DRAFT_611404 [Durotheca rogersii]